MIPDFEIPMCPEFEVKSKIGKIFKKHNFLEEYSVKIYEMILIYIMKEKYKLTKMGANIFYFELIFILINFYQQQKLMKKDILTEILFLRKKDKKHWKKKLGCKFIRIKKVMQKMVMIQIMRLVTQKHLLMSSETKNQRTRRQK